MKTVKVTLKDGTVVLGDEFDMNDYESLKEIFSDWQNINSKLKELGGRNLNVPDVFSEALFCIFFDAVRTNNAAYSYDCVSKANGNGIQVKSGSIAQDCSSFGPTSTWDEIYYADFAPNGSVDGNVYFYKLEEDFSNIVLNQKKNETFKMQQEQGRRPRFSIKSRLINANSLEPILKINLLD
jgi:Bsp6I restriction endonuclease